MTDSSMRCCTRLLDLLLRGALLVWLCVATAHAQGVSVGKAELRAGEDGYQLSVNYDVNLTYVVEQALSRGIPLYFVAEFSVVRSRWYWLDDEVFRSEQVTKLSYNVLTRQYRISRGALFQSFATLESALSMLSRQSSIAISADALGKNGEYIAAARLRLDIAQLPRLLQVNALTGKDWTLDSDWYRWVVRPVGDGRAE
ncbi:MAG TPA: DUF4390 domain-containing protein [Gallionella sp.]|nr:DUF4390 domain-containing protein [Gallionella sp.]